MGIDIGPHPREHTRSMIARRASQVTVRRRGDIMARVACFFAGHLWPTASGACEYDSPCYDVEERARIDAGASRKVYWGARRRVGWGVCARCGLAWTHTLKGRQLHVRDPGPPPSTPSSSTPQRDTREEREAVELMSIIIRHQNALRDDLKEVTRLNRYDAINILAAELVRRGVQNSIVTDHSGNTSEASDE